MRAHRYELRTPVRYRTNAAEEWHSGETKNVSRSGVLLQTDAMLDLDMPIELVLALPDLVTGEPSGHVVCQGRVVRVDHAGDDAPLAAAEFSSYKFVRDNNSH